MSKADASGACQRHSPGRHLHSWIVSVTARIPHPVLCLPSLAAMNASGFPPCASQDTHGEVRPPAKQWARQFCAGEPGGHGQTERSLADLLHGRVGGPYRRRCDARSDADMQHVCLCATGTRSSPTVPVVLVMNLESTEHDSCDILLRSPVPYTILPHTTKRHTHNTLPLSLLRCRSSSSSSVSKPISSGIVPVKSAITGWGREGVLQGIPWVEYE